MFKAALRSPNLVELLLLLLALLGLAHLAAPLADPLLAAGRGGRYLGAATPGGSLPGLLQVAQVAPQALPAGLAPLLSMLALSGWLVLWVGRMALPAGTIAVLGLAIWAGPVSMLRALAAVPDGWQTPWPAWPALALAAAPLWLLPSALLLLALPLAARCTARVLICNDQFLAWLLP